MKKIEDKYKILDQISHILLRPGTYVGSNKANTSQKYIIENGKLIQKSLTIIPSFIKIFDEVIVNSVDESKRNSNLNKIEVNIDLKEGFISVKDNGGIPVVMHKEYKQYVPQVIFGNLMSGSNYDDTDDRIVAGLNGLGTKLTNIFSTSLTVSTADGKNSFKQTYRNNMRLTEDPIIKKEKKNYTEIKFFPDLTQFGLTEINYDHFKIIEKRVYDLAACNNNIEFIFNGQRIKFNSFEDYIKMYKEEFFFEQNKDKSWSIGVSHSDTGFQQISFCNSTETYDGGTHIEYVINQIVAEIRAYFMKKYKIDIRPNEVRNQIFIFVNSTVINPSFSSQTKEKLITEVKDYGYSYEVSKKMIQSILKSEIINRLLDWVEQKKKADDSRLERELNRKVTNTKVDKLIDAKGKERWKCTICLFEGDSASGAFRKYRDPNLMGSFSLRGKFINVSEITNQKLIQNTEALNLMASIGLKIGKKVTLKDLRYGRILLYVDADFDGNSIAGLLINFFYKYWPEIFEMNILYKVETPILVAINKKTKVKEVFYSIADFAKWEKKNKSNNYEIKYKKGLGALTDDEYKNIIVNPVLTQIKMDDLSTFSLDVWFGKDSNLRKTELLKNQ